MTQNQTYVPLPEPLPRFALPTSSLRDETERALGEMAYVLHLTHKIKQALVDNRAGATAK
jgi:hypothetical protein